VALNVTVGDPKRAMIMTSLSSETLPPAPSFRCERNCAGHGLCVGEQMCRCTNGWVNDPHRGCADPIEFVTQPPQTNTVAVISNVVDAENSTESLNSTGSSNSKAITTAGGVATPTEADSQIGAIVGGSVVGGALVIAAILAIVCFHHRRRNVPPKNKVEKANANVSIYDKVPPVSHYDHGKANANISVYDKVPVSQYDHGNLQPPPIYDQGNLS
jgi:hypothetical protein